MYTKAEQATVRTRSEVGHQSSAHVVPAEDLGSVPSTYTAAHNHL